MAPRANPLKTPKEAENQLHQFHLKLALEAANIGIWEWDLKTGSVKWSDNVEQILGLENKFDGNPQTYLNHIIESDRSVVANTINKAIRKKTDFSVEHRVLLKSGNQRWIEGNGKVLFSDKGKAISLTGTVKDITERKKYEEELKQRDYLFATLSQITSQLITTDWKKVAQIAIQKLGEALNVDRVYIFENDPLVNNKLISTSQRFEWSSSTSTPQIDNPSLQGLYIENFKEYVDILLQNKPYISHVKDIIDNDLRELLSGQSIFSIILFPIFVRNAFWGFIGFDECKFEREWTEVEYAALLSFSSSFASAIERKLAVKEISDSAESYIKLFDTVGEAIYLQDFNGVFINVNQRAIDLYGYQKKDFIGKTPMFLSADGKNENINLPEIFQKAIAGQSQSFEWWGKKITGKVFLKEVHLNKGVYFGQEVIIATAWDITERKKFEEELKESEQRFRTLQQASFGGIGLHDGGVILDCNQGLSDLTGYSREELLGMDGLQLIAPEWREIVLNNINQGYEQLYDVEGIRKDGSRYFLEVKGKMIPYNGKQIRVTEFRDISQRKLTEGKIKEQNLRLKNLSEDLKNKNDQLEEFTQIVSHNLRSPAGNIVTLLNLYEKAKNDDERAEYFSLMKETGNTILTSLQELNEVLKIQQNKDIKSEHIRFEDALGNVKKMLTGKIMEINAEISHDFSDAPTVYFPYIYLESVMLNLLSNALKYNDPQKKPLVTIRSKNTAVSVILELTDNGLGIDLEKYGHQIFKMRKTFHKHPEARGIGLFLVKNQMEAMGGTISVTSKDKEGTTFTVTFIKP